MKEVKRALFRIQKECKHSRRYECLDEKFPIQTIYVRRDFAEGRDRIELSVSAPEEGV